MFVARQLLGSDLVSTLGTSRSVPPAKSAEASDDHRLVVPSHWPPARFQGLELEGRHEVLEGYELYAVEQWISSRDRVVPAIAVYTGDHKHLILVDTFVPVESDELSSQHWEAACSSLRLDGARPKQTSFGLLYVTSIAAISPTLNVVKLPSPSALVPPTLTQIYLNINLRKLGCGARSGLTLSDPTAAQQDRFLAMYSLHDTKSIEGFTSTVLGLIGLVQEALSLFGIGPFAAELSAEMKEYNEAGMNASVIAKEDGMAGPDGLFCDYTSEGLAAWAMDFGEPLFKLPHDNSEGTRLLPAVLAGLLSVVYSTRMRLAVLHSHHVPRDPFLQRRRFLIAYHNTKTVSPRSQSHHPNVFLDVAGIVNIRSQYQQRTSSDTFRVKRALRSKLEDLSTLAATSADDSKDQETSNLSVMVQAIKNGYAAEVDEVQLLWLGSRRTKKKKRTYRWLVGDRGDAGTGDETSETEAENQSKKRLFIKDVKGRAGRAGRKFGGGVSGLLDKSTTSSHRHSIMEESDDGSLRPPRPEPMSRNSFDLSSRMDLSLSMVRTRSSTGTEDLSRYRPTDTQTTQLDELAHTGPSQHHLPRRKPTRPELRRRNITEYTGLIDSSGETDEEEVNTEAPSNVFAHARQAGHHRRRSFTSFDLVPSHITLDSEKRLQSDVALCTAYVDLHSRRERLYALAASLESINTSYGQALDYISQPIQDRRAQLAALNQRAQDLISTVESPASPAHPQMIRDELEEGIDRARYSQVILDDKIHDLREFKDKLEKRLGSKEGPGTITKAFGFVLKNSPSESMRKTAHYWAMIRAACTVTYWWPGKEGQEDT